VVKDKVGRTPGESGVSKSMEWLLTITVITAVITAKEKFSEVSYTSLIITMTAQDGDRLAKEITYCSS